MRLNPMTFLVLAAATWGAFEYYKIAYPRPLHVSGSITGAAQVTDGDTLKIAGRRVRLVGIDACEMGQPAISKETQIDCGQWARSQMIELTGAGASAIRCDLHGTDRYGRDLGTCFNGATDLNKAMLESGFAFLYTGSTPPPGYAAAARAARAAQRGVWAFQEVSQPYDYRKSKAGS